MVGKVLGGVGEEGDLVDGLLLLDDGFDDLSGCGVTFPGHQGCGSTLAQTRLPLDICLLSGI